MRRLLIPLFLTAPLLAACGGGSSTATKTATSSSATSAMASGAGGTATTASTAPPNFSGNSGSSWCDLDRSLQNSAQFQNSLKDPHGWVNQLNSLIPKVESKAPGAIKTDVQTLIAALRVFEKALADTNYDFSKINPSQLAGLNTPNLTATTERITAYDKQVCGTKG